uniref:Bax inhibitor 1 n=1 Tax=Setaria digitata TaxID=48799 RepID=A0A915PQU1_9BILA
MADAVLALRQASPVLVKQPSQLRQPSKTAVACLTGGGEGAQGERMASRRETTREESDVLRNFRNIFTSLNDKLEKDVQEHLRAVYGTLALGLMAAAIGAWLHLFIDFLRDSFFLSFGSILLMIVLLRTPHTANNERKRFGYFIAFCILSGVSCGPVIEQALVVDPSTILTAFLATAAVFGSFTMAALHAPSTKFLHLGGIITSGLLFIMITALFSHSAFMHTTCLWLAFVINCTLVLYDTQLICEKRRRGDRDYVLHTIELFIDFINLFRYILAVLSEKKICSAAAIDSFPFPLFLVSSPLSALNGGS